MAKVKKIALLTSGGDSPGMNCAIRAIVRTCVSQNIEAVGIMKGYRGLLSKDFYTMDAASVGNILQRGGTILQSSRCKSFFEKETRQKAADILKKNKIDCLIVIGGDGSFNGAHLLSRESKIPVIGIPGTIDNDISGTEYTIGFDTAVTTAIEAVDKIRDTASSHDRTFLVEVMGRNSSSIALKVAICTGAETVVLAGKEVDYPDIVETINRGKKRGKNSSIIIVAEGPVAGRSYDIQTKLSEFGIRSRVCILGHTQRGGSPMSQDRYISSIMGHQAVMSAIAGNFNQATVVQDGQVCLIPLEKCLAKTDQLREDNIILAKTLAT